MTTTQVDAGTAQLPPVLYVPTAEDAADGRPHLAMTFLSNGATAVFAYSALDRLLDLYPTGRAWALLTLADLQRAHDDVTFDLLLVDQRPVVQERSESRT
jgi:hypothetical protein